MTDKQKPTWLEGKYTHQDNFVHAPDGEIVAQIVGDDDIAQAIATMLSGGLPDGHPARDVLEVQQQSMCEHECSKLEEGDHWDECTEMRAALAIGRDGYYRREYEEYERQRQGHLGDLIEKARRDD